MNIYSCIDSKNIEKIFVLFYSVYENTKNYDKLNFYIITDLEPTIEIPKFLKNNLKIRIIDFNKKWLNILEKFNKHFYNRSNWCKSDLNFARFFIFDIFPKLDRVIYLDWDMIVQTDIFNLINNYNNNKAIVATLLNNWNIKQNIINEKNKINTNILSIIEKKLNLNNIFSKNSFNSGFYIVSKKDFKLENLYKFINKIIDIQIEYNAFKFGTQVIMNLLLENVEFIDYKWNTNKIDSSSFIIHWCGHKKPWDSNDPIWYEYFNKLYSKKEEMKNKHETHYKLLNKKALILLKNT